MKGALENPCVPPNDLVWHLQQIELHEQAAHECVCGRNKMKQHMSEYEKGILMLPVIENGNNIQARKLR